jgi:mono/diheme cytochrome c family protein
MSLARSLSAGLGLALGAAVMTATAQSARTARDGVYSPEQALRGQALFGMTCAACHGSSLEGGAADDAPPLRRDTFLPGWTLRRLFTFIARQMPPNEPGRLSDAEYRAVVAYLLKENGFPSGAAELPSDLQALDAIVLVDARGAERPNP